MIDTDSLIRPVLDACRSGQPYPALLLNRLVEEANDPEVSRALFRDLVEPLCDAFEPAWCDAYAALFSDVIAQSVPIWSARELRARYRRIRVPRPVSAEPRTVYVLSRVTLGADVAVTSVVLDAAKQRFPSARIVLVGTSKCHALFDADPRIEHLEAPYARTGLLADRLAVGVELRQALEAPDSLVLDPDSRLSQLGLLPLCAEERYRFFESRSAGGEAHDTLTSLTGRWCETVLGIGGAKAYVAPGAAPVLDEGGLTAVSFGCGENPAKRVAGGFEEELIDYMLTRGARILVDQGAGGEETARVRRLLERFPGELQTWSGAFAPFAASILRARAYVGYDSAGQHVAAVAGTPLLTIFAGEVNERMYSRWRPSGAGRIEIVRPDGRPALDLAMRAYDILSA